MTDAHSPRTGRGPVARRRELRGVVLQEGYARLEDLAERFEVSVITMHRDLDALEQEGSVVKIRGGATANPSALVEAGVAERRGSMQREKLAIAAEAAGLLTHGQTVFLDDSTTVLVMVEHLRKRPPMVIASNFLTAASALRDLTTTEVVLLGGRYHALQDSCVGMHTIAAIERVHADVFFMCTTALSGGRLLHRSEDTVGHGEARVSQERRVFVERLPRQPLTKTGNQRRLVLPDAAVAMLKRRRARTEWHDAEDPVFAATAGGWL